MARTTMLKKIKGILTLISAVTVLTWVIQYKYLFREVQYSDGELIRVETSSFTELNLPPPLIVSNHSDGFHVIITFRLMNITNKNESARMNEYIDCLKSFLNNSHVKQVHLMHDSPEMPGYIQKKAGAHPKLMIHWVDSPDVVLTLHQFAFTHLQGEVVVITQADIILGEGFEKVNRSTLVKNRLLYGLSRHPICPKDWNQCKKYVGSHDMFVFVPEGKLTKEARTVLSHHVYFYGTENAVLYVYANILKYRLLNPCRVLKIYHHHCSGIRVYPSQQKRVRSRSRTSRPTSALV